MNLFEDIWPLFNIGIATISLAQLRFVAWQSLLKAAAAASASVDKKKNDPKEENEEGSSNEKNERIRTILSSFKEGTADASAEQSLLLELKEYLTSSISSSNSAAAATEGEEEVFGCRIEDLEMAVTTLLMPKSMTQLLDCHSWYSRKSKEFRWFCQRSGGLDFYGKLLDMKNMPAIYHSVAAEDTAAEDNTAAAAAAVAAPRTPTSSSFEPMLVAWNNYRVDTGPSGKELFYMIFLDHVQQRIIVTFRGSITLADWAHDIRVNMHSMNNPFYVSSSTSSESTSHHAAAAAAPDQEQQGDSFGGDRGGGGGSSTRSRRLEGRQSATLRIHAGFYQYLCVANHKTGDDSKFDQIIRQLHDLLKRHPTYQLVVTGHSLGGASSTLFAFMAAAAAATSASSGGDSKDSDDDDNNSGTKKDISERFRMWLPTPNKVSKLFGGATVAGSAVGTEADAAAATDATEPPSLTQEVRHDAAVADNQAKDEVEHSGSLDTEASFFHIGLPTPITVVSFGSPTVGDDAFCRAFGLLEERGVLRHFRIANEDDIVPSVPVSSIPAKLERVYMYHHTGLQLLQLSQTTPGKQFYRWCSRQMNKKKFQNDPGAALFRINHGNRKKMPNSERNKNNNNSNKSKTDVAAAATDFANAVGGLHLRTPLPHLPNSYHKRLHRIEVYLRQLSLDQLYQEYLADDFNDNNNINDGNDDDQKTGTSQSGGVRDVQQMM